MQPIKLTRREALTLAGTAMIAPLIGGAAEARPRFSTRGIVLYPWDLSLASWPERVAKAGLSTIAIHAAQRLDVVIDFVTSDPGQAFRTECKRRGVQVEYELHALGSLLSRELFYRDPSLFRMDRDGRRNPDCNCCPTSAQALEIIASKAVEVARVLKSSTHRYYYWPDDGGQWCSCPRCKDLAASDQATLVENAIAAALRKHVDPEALVSHIAYHNTIIPPKTVKPDTGLFVEFAPINRVYSRSIADRDVKLRNAGPDDAVKTHGDLLDMLDANLNVFGRSKSQVLEYWLDVSFHSNWTRPAVKLPWDAAIVRRDADAYAGLGVRSITTFATWIDADYIKRFGEPPLEEYGRALKG